MMFKVLTVAILAALISEAYFDEDEVPKGCTIPNNAKPFDVKELYGKVWFIHRLVNTGDNFDFACPRAEFVAGSKEGTFHYSVYFYVTKTQKLDSHVCEGKQLSDELLLKINLKDMLTVHSHKIKFDNGVLMEDMCFSKNGTFLFQGVVMWTTNQKVNKAVLESELKASGIDAKDVKDIYQGDDCFKYKGK